MITEMSHERSSWQQINIDMGNGMEPSRCQANTWTMTVDDESSFLPLDHFNSLRTDKPKQGKSEGFDSCDWPSNLKLDSNHWFFPLKFDGWLRKTIGTSSIQCQALCIISIPSGEFETGVTVRKPSIQIEIGDILSCVTLKFNGWPWKTIGHIFYTTSSFVHHFKSMGEIKVVLESVNS